MANNPLPIVAEYYGSTDPKLRRNAVVALGALAATREEELGSDWAGDAVAQECGVQLARLATTDPDGIVRDAAVKEIVQSAIVREYSLAELKKLLNSDETSVRAFEVLGNLRAQGIEIEPLNISVKQSLSMAFSLGKSRRRSFLQAWAFWPASLYGLIPGALIWIFYIAFYNSIGTAPEYFESTSMLDRAGGLAIGCLVLGFLTSALGVMLAALRTQPAQSYPRRFAGLLAETAYCASGFLPSIMIVFIYSAIDSNLGGWRASPTYLLGSFLGIVIIRVVSMGFSSAHIPALAKGMVLMLWNVAFVYALAKLAGQPAFDDTYTGMRGVGLSLAVFTVLSSFTFFWARIDHVRDFKRPILLRHVLICVLMLSAGALLAVTVYPMTPSTKIDPYEDTPAATTGTTGSVPNYLSSDITLAGRWHGHIGTWISANMTLTQPLPDKPDEYVGEIATLKDGKRATLKVDVILSRGPGRVTISVTKVSNDASWTLQGESGTVTYDGLSMSGSGVTSPWAFDRSKK